MADDENKPDAPEAGALQDPVPNGPVDGSAPAVPATEAVPDSRSTSEPAINDEHAAQPNSDAVPSSTTSTSRPLSASQGDAPDQLPFKVPARNYPRDARLLQYTPPQPPPPPNTVLPRFFKLLAAFIFITGSSASLVAFLYQRYLLPKIALTRARVTAVHQHHLSKYDKLVLSLRYLLSGSDPFFSTTKRKLEARKTSVDPTLERAAQADIAELDEKAEQAPTVSEKQDELEEGNEVAEVQEHPREDVTLGLRTSMEKLATTLQGFSPLPSKKKSDSELPEPTSSQSLLRSLETFTTYLSNESFYASTPSFASSAYGYSYGNASSQIPVRSGMDKEKVSQLKNEIRILKGALLTRKNFAPVRDGI